MVGPSRLLCGLLVTQALPAIVHPVHAQGDALTRAGWIAGCWEARSGSWVTTEMWMPPAGRLMIGGSRTMAGGVAREFEHLRIRQHDQTLVYTAIPSGQRETDFQSTSVTDTLPVFENKQHDFPQRIAYQREGADSVVVRVEAVDTSGATRGCSIPMRRTSCTASPR